MIPWDDQEGTHLGRSDHNLFLFTARRGLIEMDKIGTATIFQNVDKQ